MLPTGSFYDPQGLRSANTDKKAEAMLEDETIFTLPSMAQLQVLNFTHIVVSAEITSLKYNWNWRIHNPRLINKNPCAVVLSDH